MYKVYRRVVQVVWKAGGIAAAVFSSFTSTEASRHGACVQREEIVVPIDLWQLTRWLTRPKNVIWRRDNNELNEQCSSSYRNLFL
jgi:hypothetical protein